MQLNSITYLEILADISLNLVNPLLSQYFIFRKLMESKAWNFLCLIVLAFGHVTVIFVRHDCLLTGSTRDLAFMTKFCDVKTKWLLRD